MASWKESAEGGQAEQIPLGKHDNLRITRFMRSTKKEGELVTDKGDPKAYAIVTDTQDRERLMTLVLIEKCQFKVAQLLEAMGADLDQMDADGLSIDAFKDEMFATRQLCDRPFSAEIRPQKDNPQYIDVVPLRRAPGSPTTAATTKPAEDEIPF